MENGTTSYPTRLWAHQCDAAVRELMPLHELLNDLPGPYRQRHALMLLSSHCFQSTESSLYLVHGQRLWDAEILIPVLNAIE